MSNAVVYKVSYVDPDCDETSEGGRHYTGDCLRLEVGDCLRLEVYERHDGERTGYGCVERIDFDLHDGGDGIMEMLGYLTGWDADVQAERLGLVHPCGHCGEAEGAGAAGLCQGCAEGGTVCPTCGEEMVDGDEHYTCEAFAALLAPQSCGACGACEPSTFTGCLFCGCQGHDVPQCPVAHPTSCALCAAHYGDNGVCDEGKPVRSPHRIGGGR